MLPDCLYIGLGGNFPDTEAALASAIRQLSSFWSLRSLSLLYITAPQDYLDQPQFLNMVGAWELPSDFNLIDLLDTTQFIETGLGRERHFPKGPRIVDLDILLAGPAAINLPRLTIPHPRMHQRRFVLEPLLEIAPGIEIPGMVIPSASLLAACAEQAIYSQRPLKYTDPSI